MDLLTRRINAHRIHFYFPSGSGKGWVSGFGQHYSAVSCPPVKPAGPCNVPHAFKPNDIRIVIEQDDLPPSARIRHLVCRSQTDRPIRGTTVKPAISLHASLAQKRNGACATVVHVPFGSGKLLAEIGRQTHTSVGCPAIEIPRAVNISQAPERDVIARSKQGVSHQ